ncbi:MAG: hypothetical protein H6605_09425 [Flavobacteriales bacterium]|nr:hypothetical protein [Flavobacteriales bacterium]
MRSFLTCLLLIVLNASNLCGQIVSEPSVADRPYEEELKNKLEQTYFKNVSEQVFTIEYKKESKIGFHYKFKHSFKGYPVYDSYILVHLDKTLKPYLVQTNLKEITKEVTETDFKGQNTWFKTDGDLVAARQVLEFNVEKGQNFAMVYDRYGRILSSNDPRLYFFKKDSMVSAMVYLPNPIVTDNAKYGGSYVDNVNKTNSILDNARRKVRFPATYDSGKFILQHDKFRIKDLNPPIEEPVQPTDTFFNYKRDESGFEDVNAYYHIYAYYEYLKGKGFVDLIDSIEIDSHGENGDDNSFFDPSKYPFTLEFGTGGVDDAEDAQVVIHELGHSLSHLAATGTANGGERLIMEEGQADYLCLSYSRSLSSNHPYRVFSWDAHNEFWDGFNGNTTLTYPERSGIKDIDREIWSTALICMLEKIGREKSDEIVLNYYYHQVGNSNMPAMARVILKMDSMLHGGKHVAAIWQCFNDRQILDTVPWYLIGVRDLVRNPDYKLINSYAFSLGLEPAEIKIAKNVDLSSVEIYDQLGQKLRTIESGEPLIMHPEDFVPGIYYIRLLLMSGKNTEPLKLIR